MPGDDKRMVDHPGNQLWHTDSSFKRVPALASLLSGRECPPEGGETGDLVMWDNRCMLHRGRAWDYARHRRVMHRTTVAGEGPTA